MKLLGLLLISLMSHGVRANKISNDPAPGRSGPPNLSRNIYATESHEAYRPSVSSLLPSNTIHTTIHHHNSNQDRFASSLSSENVEYIESSESRVSEKLSELSKATLTEEDYSTSSDVVVDLSSIIKCNLSDSSSRLQSYVALGDKIIRKEINNARDYDSTDKVNERANEVDIDVTHDVFETTTTHSGLIRGIIYKGKAHSSSFSSVSFLSCAFNAKMIS